MSTGNTMTLVADIGGTNARFALADIALPAPLIDAAGDLVTL